MRRGNGGRERVVMKFRVRFGDDVLWGVHLVDGLMWQNLADWRGKGKKKGGGSRGSCLLGEWNERK